MRTSGHERNRPKHLPRCRHSDYHNCTHLPATCAVQLNLQLVTAIMKSTVPPKFYFADVGSGSFRAGYSSDGSIYMGIETTQEHRCQHLLSFCWYRQGSYTSPKRTSQLHNIVNLSGKYQNCVSNQSLPFPSYICIEDDGKFPPRGTQTPNKSHMTEYTAYRVYWAPNTMLSTCPRIPQSLNEEINP